MVVRARHRDDRSRRSRFLPSHRPQHTDENRRAHAESTGGASSRAWTRREPGNRPTQLWTVTWDDFVSVGPRGATGAHRLQALRAERIVQLGIARGYSLRRGRSGFSRAGGKRTELEVEAGRGFYLSRGGGERRRGAASVGGAARRRAVLFEEPEHVVEPDRATAIRKTVPVLVRGSERRVDLRLEWLTGVLHRGRQHAGG